MSAELPRPLKAEAFFVYVIGKYKNHLKTEALEKQHQELIELNLKHDNYIADCLWALATDRRFVDGKAATLQRWHIIANPPKEENKKEKLTKQDVINQYKRLRVK